MTKPIPNGSVNTTINVPREWRLALGKAAHRRGLSVGELLKRAAESFVDRPTGRQLAEIRTAAAKIGGAMVKTAMCGALAVGIWLQGIARPKEIVRTRAGQLRTVKDSRRPEFWAGEWEVA